ncbi:MAG: hypothetical protein KatS3mg068_2679 [Candidatus Sericytochromatia bacterium]|nr:MAG: hypothetical protein KatS3mg068_2679 [Candidatus Sericytochromatia bacterium]
MKHIIIIIFISLLPLHSSFPQDMKQLDENIKNQIDYIYKIYFEKEIPINPLINLKLMFDYQTLKKNRNNADLFTEKIKVESRKFTYTVIRNKNKTDFLYDQLYNDSQNENKKYFNKEDCNLEDWQLIGYIYLDLKRNDYKIQEIDCYELMYKLKTMLYLSITENYNYHKHVFKYIRKDIELNITIPELKKYYELLKKYFIIAENLEFQYSPEWYINEYYKMFQIKEKLFIFFTQFHNITMDSKTFQQLLRRQNKEREFYALGEKLKTLYYIRIFGMYIPNNIFFQENINENEIKNAILLDNLREAYKNMKNNPFIKNITTIEEIINCLENLSEKHYQNFSLLYYSQFFWEYGKNIDYYYQFAQDEKQKELINSFFDIYYNKGYYTDKANYILNNCKKIQSINPERYEEYLFN